MREHLSCKLNRRLVCFSGEGHRLLTRNWRQSLLAECRHILEIENATMRETHCVLAALCVNAVFVSQRQGVETVLGRSVLEVVVRTLW